MRVTEIYAHKNSISFAFDGVASGNVEIIAYVPLVGCGRDNRRAVCVVSADITDKRVEIERFADNYDLLTCAFVCRVDNIELDGVKYVTDFTPDATKYHYPEPTAKNNKPIGTWVIAEPEDIDELGVGYLMTEIDLAWIITLNPAKEDIPHIYNGRTYYFKKDMMDLYERFSSVAVKKKIPCLIRFINRFHYQNVDGDAGLFKLLSHPGYDPAYKGVEMSAFNLTSEEAFSHYCAALDFLFERYTDPDNPYCHSVIMDIGNEVNSQGVWHNCGEMTCGEFMEEYSVALRTAWLLSHKYYAHQRINISLEHHFSVPFIPAEPLRYYPSKVCLDQLTAICRRDGDFDFGISAHPYPTNLSCPNFYDDADAIFSLDTPKATMKNLEVWAEYASLEHIKYRQKPRRVLFDEQGFHTDRQRPETFPQGAYAFVLACLKIRKCKGIDLFLIHRYADQLGNDECGLYLGLRESLSYVDHTKLLTAPGEKKPIYHAFCAMYTDDEQKWVNDARKYIGEEKFDELLNPEFEWMKKQES